MLKLNLSNSQQNIDTGQSSPFGITSPQGDRGWDLKGYWARQFGSRFQIIIKSQRLLTVMKTESELYQQSQEEIIPIIDYIPVDSEGFPESARWRMKEHLDESREKVMHPSFDNFQQISSLRIHSRNERLHTDSAANDYDKKTTSIMQGYSANTIPSNELSIHTIKDNLRSYMTYNQPQKEANEHSFLQFYSNQTSNKIMGSHRQANLQRVRSRSIHEEKSIHFMNQRSKLLKNIDRSMEGGTQKSEREKYELKQCRKEKKLLLSQILEKLESNLKQKKEIELVKSNCKETEVSLNEKNEKSTERDSKFIKKPKKWVLAKNALKEAAEDSTSRCLSNSKALEQHQIIHNSVSEWRNAEQSEQAFDSPTLIPLVNSNNAFFPEFRKESSVNNFTVHKDFPNRREDEIFTFSNLQTQNVQRHIKNVSITVSQSSSKEYIASLQGPIVDCVLCKVIGKRCSFH